jgi:hypothetical protein
LSLIISYNSMWLYNWFIIKTLIKIDHGANFIQVLVLFFLLTYVLTLFIKCRPYIAHFVFRYSACFSEHLKLRMTDLFIL